MPRRHPHGRRQPVSAQYRQPALQFVVLLPFRKAGKLASIMKRNQPPAVRLAQVLKAMQAEGPPLGLQFPQMFPEARIGLANLAPSGTGA